jgi:hypothetical protein
VEDSNVNKEIDMKNYLIWILMSLFLASCGKEVFVARTQSSGTSINPSAVTTNKSCANFTKVKPPVDILFVVDNSGSSNLLSSSLKTAIANTIQTVSSEFDYHILVAPLINVGTDSSLPIVAASPDGLGTVLPRIVPAESINFFSPTFAVAGGSDEKGFSRVRDLINNNMSNNIFRKGAYTLVVLISNGNDTDYVLNTACPQCPPTSDNYSTRLNEFKMFTKKYYDEQISLNPAPALRATLNSNLLRSVGFHFISLVSHQYNPGAGCPVNGNRYRLMSRDIYNYVFNTNYSGGSSVNSYDICGMTNFAPALGTVSSTIQAVTLEHKYDYWAVSSSNNFDPTKVVVKKNGVPLTKGDLLNGFILFPDLEANPSAAAVTQDTRYAPTPGEPFTGYLVKLFGNGRAQFNASTGSADCMEVITTAPAEYYGYFTTPLDPDLSSVVVKKNGSAIASSEWTFEGYSPSRNIQIVYPPVDPNNYVGATPGLYRSGYFFRLKSGSIYTNGDRIEVNYKPKGQ